MPLADDVQNRIASPRLIELTRAGSTSATTIDTTKLGLAVTDAEQDFARVTGIAYDSTLASHTAIGVRLVVLILMEWAGMRTDFVSRERDALTKQMQDLALRGPKARLTPTTDGGYIPSSEPTDAPHFDRSRFNDLRPRDPAGDASIWTDNN